MSYEYSENTLVQESAGHLLHDELGWDVYYAYNTEKLGVNGTFGRKSYREIVLWRYFKDAVFKLNPWLTESVYEDAVKKLEHHLNSASLMQINEEKYGYLTQMEDEIRQYEAENKTGNKDLDTILTAKSLVCQN